MKRKLTSRVSWVGRRHNTTNVERAKSQERDVNGVRGEECQNIAFLELEGRSEGLTELLRCRLQVCECVMAIGRRVPKQYLVVGEGFAIAFKKKAPKSRCRDGEVWELIRRHCVASCIRSAQNSI